MNEKLLKDKGYTIYHVANNMPFFARKYENKIAYTISFDINETLVDNPVYSIIDIKRAKNKVVGYIDVDFEIENDEQISLINNAYREVKELEKKLNEEEQ